MNAPLGYGVSNDWCINMYLETLTLPIILSSSGTFPGTPFPLFNRFFLPIKKIFLWQVLLKFPDPLDKMLTVAQGDEWKRIRSTLTPTFSAHKMKQMVPLMNSACDMLMKKFDEISCKGESFDILR